MLHNQDPIQPDDIVPGHEPAPDDDADTGDQPEDLEHQVAHQVNPEPIREEDEEELAEADLQDKADVDDLKQEGDV